MWGQTDPIHLPDLSRKAFLVLRGSRGSGEEGEMKGKHAQEAPLQMKAARDGTCL